MMTLPLLENLPEIYGRVADSTHLILFLDFDGTLAPIVEFPAMARLFPGTRQILFALSLVPHISIAIVSGRLLTDVRERVGLEGVMYVGNHGLEISGLGLQFVEPGALAHQATMERLSQRLAADLNHIPGAEVENKGITLSVHFRRVPPAHLAELERALHAALAPVSQDLRLAVGKKVYDIRPRVDWHKGSAVRWIRRQIGGLAALPIYVGDDATDEDAFLAVSDGITVRVGEPSESAAGYYLTNPAEVHDFLFFLAGLASAHSAADQREEGQ